MHARLGIYEGAFIRCFVEAVGVEALKLALCALHEPAMVVVVVRAPATSFLTPRLFYNRGQLSFSLKKVRNLSFFFF